MQKFETEFPSCKCSVIEFQDELPLRLYSIRIEIGD